MFMNRDSFGGEPDHYMVKPSGYITSPGNWDSSESMLRERVQMSQNDKRTPSDIFKIVNKKLYDTHHKALMASAFVKERYTFNRALDALQQGYSLCEFFGGMSKYGDSKSLIRSLGLDFADRFPGANELFSPGETIPVLYLGRVNFETYCTGVYVWDMLLFFSIMRRPRRCITMLDDICETLTRHMFETHLPATVFPYRVTTFSKMDDLTGKNKVCVFDTHRRQDYVIRRKTQFTENFRMQYPGVKKGRILEDEAHMSTLLAICSDLDIENVFDFPIAAGWPVSLHLQEAKTYPFQRYNLYCNDEVQGSPASSTGVGKADENGLVVKPGVGEVYVFFNPTFESLTVFGITDESVKKFSEIAIEYNGGYVLDEEHRDWTCSVEALRVYKVGARGVRTWDQCIANVFKAGFGPRRMYSRCCVAAMYNDRIYCVVPHDESIGGCPYAQHRTCYFCHWNPFYNLKRGNEHHFRCTASALENMLVPVGTMLFLDTRCAEFQQVDRSQMDDAVGASNSRVLVTKYNADGTISFIPSDESNAQHNQARHRDASHVKFLRVYVDTPRSFTPQHGKLYVSFKSRHRSSEEYTSVSSVYVDPSSLYTNLGEDMGVVIDFIYKHVN